MQKKWTFAAVLCLCLLACLAVPARAEEENSAPYIKTDIPVSGEPADLPVEKEDLTASEEPAGPMAGGNGPAAQSKIVDSGTCGKNGGENLSWSLDSEGTLTISGTGEMDDYYYSSGGPWPSFRCTRLVIGEGVASIGLSAFDGCSSLAGGLVLPASVTSIRGNAFRDCAGLTSLTLPPAAQIQAQAFEGCSGLTGTLTIPGGVSAIELNAFAGCSGLTSLVLEEGVTSIENGAFSRCDRLTSVSIPSTVTSIEGGAFSRCEQLREITVSPENAAYASDGGILFNGDRTQLLWCPVGLARESYAVPDTVSSIADHAFEGCTGLTGTLTLPSNLASIGDFAFANCTGLTGPLTIPGSVTTIGQGAFTVCTGLTGTLALSKTLTSIGTQAFACCPGLTGIAVDPENPVYVSVDGCLFDKSVSTLLCVPGGLDRDPYQIPASVTAIGRCAFQGCESLTGTLTIPEGVASIGGLAFDACSGLTAIFIPGSVASIENMAFSNCRDLTALTVDPNNPVYTSINGVLFNKAVTELIQYPRALPEDFYEVPDTVASIREFAFHTAALTGIAIPIHVTTVEDYAFELCTSLKSVFYAGSELEWRQIDVGFRNDPLENAAIYYNGERPAPSIPVSSVTQTGAAAVQADPAALAAILPASGKAPVVFAAPASRGGAAYGDLDAATGKITFQASLKSGDKIFFLDSDTFIPLAKPSILE